MSTVHIDLPVKPSEAAALAALIFEQAEGRKLADDVRARIAGRAASLGLVDTRPFFGSLVKDPVAPSAYYIAADALRGGGAPPASLLLHLTLASAPANQLFPAATLVGRMRPGGGSREVVVNAAPFAATDRENIRKFVDSIDGSVAPRPRGSQATLAAPAALGFEPFRAIRRAGPNLAALYGDPDLALWSAIRAGWRDAWSLEADPIPAVDIESAKSAAAEFARATGFVFDLTGAEDPAGAASALFDAIKSFRAKERLWKSFDLELRGAPMEVLDSLKALGKPPQFVGADAGAEDLPALAAAARQRNAVLSFELDGNEAPETLRRIGRATNGRWKCRLPASATAESLAAAAEDLRS